MYRPHQLAHLRPDRGLRRLRAGHQHSQLPRPARLRLPPADLRRRHPGRHRQAQRGCAGGAGGGRVDGDQRPLHPAQLQGVGGLRPSYHLSFGTAQRDPRRGPGARDRAGSLMAVFQYLVSIATVGVIFSLLCLGLNMRYGWSGDLDLAYYMFGALGAYTYGVVTLPPANLPPPDGYILGLSAPFVVGIVAAMLVAGLGSLLLGAIALRNLRGDYFSIVTIVTTLIVYATISQYTPLFDGFSGIFGFSEPFNSVLGLDVETYPPFYLGGGAWFLVLVSLFGERLFKSPYGRAMRAIREDDKAAMAFGRDV